MISHAVKENIRQNFREAGLSKSATGPQDQPLWNGKEAAERDNIVEAKA